MAYEFYVTIDGAQQGRFKGESPKDKFTDKIIGLEFLTEIKTSQESPSTHPIVRHFHGPVQITKAWGASSPQIFKAITTNESLRSVLFEFIRSSPLGTEEVWYTIELTDARISQYRKYIGDVGNTVYDNTSESLELEEISFTFHKIEIHNLESNTVAAEELLR